MLPLADRHGVQTLLTLDARNPQTTELILRNLFSLQRSQQSIMAATYFNICIKYKSVIQYNLFQQDNICLNKFNLSLQSITKITFILTFIVIWNLHMVNMNLPAMSMRSV